MRWRWIVLAVAMALLFGAPPLIAYRLLHSEQGLQFVLGQLGRIPNVRIEATGASGTLAGPLVVERLVVEHAAVRIEARGLRLDVVIRPLLNGELRFEELSAARVDVALKDREQPPPREPGFLPDFLRIEAREAHLSNLSLTLVNGERFEAASARAAFDINRWRIRLRELVIADPAGQIEGNVALTPGAGISTRIARVHGIESAWPDMRAGGWAAAGSRIDGGGSGVQRGFPGKAGRQGGCGPGPRRGAGAAASCGWQPRGRPLVPSGSS